MRGTPSGRVLPDEPELVIELTGEDLLRWDVVRRAERVSRHRVGSFVVVTDQLTGDEYKVATAPCGLSCHCWAVAVRVKTA